MLKQAKKALTPALCSLGLLFGIPWDRLISRLGRDALIEQMKVLFRQPVQGITAADEKLDILFMPYIGCFQGNNMIQVTLGRILQERGHRVMEFELR